MASRKGSKSGTAKASASVVVAVVGDGGVGKSCLLLAYLSGRYPAEYLPGPVDWHSEFDHLTRPPHQLEKDGVEVSVSLVDTCGLDEYQKLREKVCCGADVFLVCFDVTNPASLDRVRDQWVPEIRGYNPAAPFVLVATKVDERIKAQIDGKASSAVVSFAQGKALGQEMGAHTYCECSAKRTIGLKKVFEEAASAAIMHSANTLDKRTSCTVS